VEHSLEIGLLLTGLALLLVGWAALVVKAFRQSAGWGLLCLIPPLFLFFILLRPRKAWLPAVIMLVGILTGAGPLIANRLLPVDLGPRENLVNGDLEITLTGWDNSEPTGIGVVSRRLSRWLNRTANGWDRRDYSLLQTRTEVVYLQMANADVTDETLDYLRGLRNLRRLDLSDSQITDDGLQALQDLPALDTLYIKRTAVTDRGVRDYLLSLQSLKRLDLSGTDTTPEARKAWREAVPGRMTIPR
jgi:hypothetical protein